MTFLEELYLIGTLADDHDIHASWHTSKTGTYRWQGAIVDNRQSGVTYTRVLDIVRSPEGATS